MSFSRSCQSLARYRTVYFGFYLPWVIGLSLRRAWLVLLDLRVVRLKSGSVDLDHATACYCVWICYLDVYLAGSRFVALCAGPFGRLEFSLLQLLVHLQVGLAFFMLDCDHQVHLSSWKFWMHSDLDYFLPVLTRPLLLKAVEHLRFTIKVPDGRYCLDLSWLNPCTPPAYHYHF